MKIGPKFRENILVIPCIIHGVALSIFFTELLGGEERFVNAMIAKTNAKTADIAYNAATKGEKYVLDLYQVKTLGELAERQQVLDKEANAREELFHNAGGTKTPWGYVLIAFIFLANIGGTLLAIRWIKSTAAPK